MQEACGRMRLRPFAEKKYMERRKKSKNLLQ
jgi:hypothetical protein